MFLERVALLVSGHCLVGWDTGGESWETLKSYVPRARPSPRATGRRSLGALSPFLVVVATRKVSIPRSRVRGRLRPIPRTREPHRSTMRRIRPLPRKGYPANADRGTSFEGATSGVTRYASKTASTLRSAVSSARSAFTSPTSATYQFFAI